MRPKTAVEFKGLNKTVHDLIVSYKSTEQAKFPLILVIGREPNSSDQFSDSTGTYNFDTASGCAFWNEAYAVIGKLCAIDGQALKNMCRGVAASPIAFSDISPLPISNDHPEKTSLRESVQKESIREHVQAIVSQKQILDRTAFALLSGHNSAGLSKQASENFTYGSTLLEKELAARNISYHSIPLLYGNNQKDILNSIELAKEAKSKIEHIFSEFESYVGTQQRWPGS